MIIAATIKGAILRVSEYAIVSDSHVIGCTIEFPETVAFNKVRFMSVSLCECTIEVADKSIDIDAFLAECFPGCVLEMCSINGRKIDELAVPNPPPDVAAHEQTSDDR